MTLRDILRAKGAVVQTIAPGATLAEAAHKLVEHNIGSLLVCEPAEATGERLLGIITERDLLHITAKYPQSWANRSVYEHMATRLVTATPDDSVEELMGLMTNNRIRHLPVLAEGRLVGLVSIGDVVKAQHDRLALENHFMKGYIQSHG